MDTFTFLNQDYEVYDIEDVPRGHVPGYVYARQSVTRDGSDSLPAQLEACFDAAPRLRIGIVGVFVEPPSTSGYKDRGRKRPKFKELLSALESGPGRCVLTFKSDRLSRGGGPGWAPLFDVLDRAGLNPDRAVATPSGWMSEFEIGIRATTDREESKKTSDRMLMAREREARAGTPRIGGRRPYGYTQRYEVIPEEQAVVREAAERVLTGESLWGIASDFAAREIPTVTNTGWTVSVLKNILTHPRMVGQRVHKGLVVATDCWAPLLDFATWERVNNVLSRRWPYATKSNPRTYPLVGFLFCGKCGAKLRSIKTQAGTRAYGCRKGPGLDGCGGLKVVAAPVEEEIKKLVVGTLCHPRYRARLVKLAGSAGEKETTTLADEVKDLEHQRETLLDVYLSGRLTKDRYDIRDDELQARIEILYGRAARQSGVEALRGLPTSPDALLAEWDARGIHYQRRLIPLVITRAVVLPAVRPQRRFDPDRLKVEPRFPAR